MPGLSSITLWKYCSRAGSHIEKLLIGWKYSSYQGSNKCLHESGGETLFWECTKTDFKENQLWGREMECSDSGLCPMTSYNWLRRTDEINISEEIVSLNKTLQLFDHKVNKQWQNFTNTRCYISPEHPQRSNNPRKTEKKNCSRMMETIAA